jgi:monovalent cation:H+ antiporter-2, CPA2 family
MYSNGMDLVLTVCISLAAALVLGYVTQRLGLSPIVGYLLAGIVVGPNTPGFAANHQVAEQLAEIGVILLMFGVGLHFNLKDLLALRKTGLPGAAGQSVAAAALGAVAAAALGGARGWPGALLYGLALSVASTVVLTRVLADHDDLHTPAGRLAVGWTVVEDLFTVLILVLLPALVPGGAAPRGSTVLALGIALLKIAGLFVLLFLIGTRVIPWLLRLAAATRSRELFTLTVLVVALGIAVGSAKLVGVSMALGAFLAGMVVGRTDFSLRAGTEALPLRDAFAVLFFVSVGMLFDPAVLLHAPLLVAATIVIVVVLKPVVSYFLVRLMRKPARTALSVGFALGQVGEFSFILATAAMAFGLLSADATSAIVVAAIVSIALNPLLRRLIDPIVAASVRGRKRRAERGERARRGGRAAARVGDDLGSAAPAETTPGAGGHAVLVGYGPVGRTLARLLTVSGVTCTVVEMNLQTVKRLRAQGIEAVYGDAGHVETLQQAGVPRAESLILSASSLQSREIIRVARDLNPDIRVLARAAYLGEKPALQAAGADLVIAEEGEVALAMNDAVLRHLGASAGRISRERKKLREEL